MDEPTEESTRTAIAQALELDHEYREMVPTWDQERIKLIRSLGRAIGRERGWRIQTFARDRDGLTSVWVVVTKGDPEDEARLQDRSRVLMDALFKDLLPPGDA